MNVLGIKTCVWGHTSVSEGMRVLPLSGWNIWNMNIYKKNNYKKQIDNRHYPITQDRNTLERTGTTFHSLFQICSAMGVYRNTSRSLVVQGLQRFSLKTCSAMFWPEASKCQQAESLVIRALATINF